MQQLPPASEEQKNIVRLALRGNVIVNAVAGSGKTTTILHIATAYSAARDDPAPILVLTYNKKLRLETKERVKRLAVENVEIHTYHSFCVRYLARNCYTDSAIVAAMDAGESLRCDKYGMIIVDECQDMTPVYFRLFCTILRRMRWYEVTPTIVILGDDKQSVYAFNNADHRFMTLAPTILGLDFASATLETTYRVPSTLCNFLNTSLLWPCEKRLSPARPGGVLRYVICDPYTRACDEFKLIAAKYSPGDIFVLAPTLRKKSKTPPALMLANTISAEGIPIYAPSDDTQIDETVSAGKVIFTTFHQAKGLERKAALVFGVDQSYNMYFARSEAVCPNEIYVSLTRASEHLTVLHSSRRRYLCGLKPPPAVITLDKYDPAPTPPGAFSRAVTDLLRHLSTSATAVLMSLVAWHQVTPPGKRVEIPTVYNREAVSDITGEAIPLYYEWKLTGTVTKAKNLQVKKGTVVYSIEKCTLATLPISKLLKVATANNAVKNNLIYRVNQIGAYNWITPTALSLCMERLAPLGGGSFEFLLSDGNIHGVVDFYSARDNILYEFKCVSELCEVHIMQLALYLYLWKKTKTAAIRSEPGVSYSDELQRIESTRGILMNILTGECIEVGAATEDFVSALIEIKTADMLRIPDEVFIKTHQQTYQDICQV